MTGAGEVADQYQNMDKPHEITYSGRDYNLIKPMLSIASAIGRPDVFEEMVDFAQSSYQRRMADFTNRSVEYVFLSYLMEAVPEDGDYRGDILLRGLREFILSCELDVSREITSKTQGELLRTLGLVDPNMKKRSPDKKTRLYWISRARLEEVALTYGID